LIQFFSLRARLQHLPALNPDGLRGCQINVQGLKSASVAKHSQVCISTIQRMYSLLKDESLDEAVENMNPAEQFTNPREPVPVGYNPKMPPVF
jgi:type I restriction enzyme, R subunit